MSKQIDAMMKELKRLLNDADDFSVIMEYFFDLAEGTDFLSHGRPKNNPKVMAIFRKAAEALLGGKTLLMENPHLTYVKKYNFYHGPCDINGYMGNIFYFAGMDKGLLKLHMHGEAKYVRMGTTVLPRATFPARAQPGPSGCND